MCKVSSNAKYTMTAIVISQNFGLIREVLDRKRFRFREKCGHFNRSEENTKTFD